MIDKLEMFIALARARHFGRAAAACGVTQPSLSAAIKHLEEHLGVQLVFRGARYQGLTPEGQRVLERAQGIVAEARALRDEMRSVKKGLAGKLRIGVIPTALPMVALLTTPFLRRHPNVSVTLLSRTSAEILQGIEQLELEAGITYLDNEPLGRVVSLPLYTEVYRLVCAPGSVFAERGAVSWADLAGLPLCLLTGDMQNRRIINQHLAEAGVRAESAVESNSTIALMAHVMTGQWVSVLPRALADLFAQSGAVRAVPMVAPEVGHLVGLIAARRDPPTPLIEALMEVARRFAD
ncbi:MAG: LysR family transcriptional regulator [Paracoccaceae bacterium]